MNMIENLTKIIRNPKKATLFLIKRSYKKFLKFKTCKRYVPSDLKELNDIKERSLLRTDISDHLVTLFVESLSIKPKVILELGVRGGESTFVLERVAKLCGSKLISVDIDDCSNASSYEDWIFIQKNDIEFAKEFENWCKKNRIESQIDILFIDTSHLFEHTLQEIKHWFPFLSNKSKVFFHDTNTKSVYFRQDKSIGFGRNNERGVIGALEKYFNKSFNEKENFVDLRNAWLIKHYSCSSGFTILEKISFFASDSSVSSKLIPIKNI